MIPKIIHYCWFGGNQIPEKDKKCIESWKKFNPDYEIKLWDESNYDISKNTYMYEAYKSKKWGFVPDYARLDIVYTYGGFYLDTDVELLRSLDDLRDNKAIMCFEDGKHVNPGLIVACEKDNPTIKLIMDNIYKDRKFILDDGTLDLTASPKMNTDELLKLGLRQDNSKQVVDTITIYPTDYFCPLDYKTGKLNKTSNTYGIHWFNSSWFTKKQLIIRDIERKFYSDNKLIYSFGRLLSLPFRIASKFELKGWDGVKQAIKKRL